jgi:hypothetical protein
VVLRVFPSQPRGNRPPPQAVQSLLARLLKLCSVAQEWTKCDLFEGRSLMRPHGSVKTRRDLFPSTTTASKLTIDVSVRQLT